MKNLFWKKDNCKKEKELKEICQLINEGKVKMSCIEIAKKLGTTYEAVRRKKSNLGLITDKRVLTPKVKKVKKVNRRMPAGLDETEQKIINYLKKKARSVGDLSREVDKSKESIIKILDSLREKNYDIKFDKEQHLAILERFPQEIVKPLELEPLYRNYWKFGIISDTHIGSIAQQTTLLHTCYKVGEEEKIDTMFHSGDMVDGIGLYRGQEQEIWLHSADDQVNWAINNYPSTKKFKTYLVGGSHDMIFKKKIGHNVLRAICEKRQDIIYRGEVSAEFIYHNKNIRVCIMHPSGGLSYAISYSPQKIVESVINAVMTKIRATNDLSLIPHIFIFGHWHRTMWMPYMGTKIFLSPCLQGQTPYLKQKGFSPVVGMLIIQVAFDDKGNITSVKHDFRDFSHLVKEKDY